MRAKEIRAVERCRVGLSAVVVVIPAILKGWIDRVFTAGFAYDLSSGRRAAAHRVVRSSFSVRPEVRNLRSLATATSPRWSWCCTRVRSETGAATGHLELFFKARNRLEITPEVATLRAGYLDRAAALGRTFFGAADIDQAKRGPNCGDQVGVGPRGLASAGSKDSHPTHGDSRLREQDC